MPKDASYYSDVWYPRVRADRAAERAASAARAEAEAAKAEERRRFRETHEFFLGDWVDKPETFSGWTEMGRLHEVLGVDALGRTTKSAEELRQAAESMDDLHVDLGRLKNPDKIAQRIMDAAHEHNYQKAQEDPGWAVRVLGTINPNSRASMYSGQPTVYITGEERMEVLGVKYEHYRDKDAAKKWYRNWARILHPDNNGGDPRADTAMREVTRIYKTMTK